MPVIEPSRAACRNMQQRAVLNTDGFFFLSMWFVVPICTGPPQLRSQGRCTSANRCGLDWSNTHLVGVRFTEGQREWEGAPPGALPAGGLANLGLPIIQALSPVCVCVCVRARSDIARHKHTSRLLPALSHPSQNPAGTRLRSHGEGGGEGTGNRRCQDSFPG